MRAEGASGVVVFDGEGEEREIGPLQVRFAPHADDLLERLAAEKRTGERVCVVSSDTRGAVDVRPGGAQARLGRVPRRVSAVTTEHERAPASRLGDRLDARRASELERLRRGE